MDELGLNCVFQIESADGSIARTIIENTLIEIGMPTNIKGFKYIVDTVMLLSKPEWKDPKWTALYYCVSQLNNCTACSVEKSIRTALRITRDNCIDYNLIEHYIGFANCENSNSLTLLYTRLNQSKQKDKALELMCSI